MVIPIILFTKELRMLPRINNSSWTTICLPDGKKLFAIIGHSKPYTNKPGEFWGSVIVIDQQGRDIERISFPDYLSLKKYKDDY
jgi:hypothetical protein